MTAINSPFVMPPAAPPTKQPTQQPGRRWITGNMPFARFALIVDGIVPLGLLIDDALHHQLGADPVNFAIHTTGLIALIFLLLSLLVTPLKSLTGFSWLVQFRRSLGLYAFFYAACHLAIYYYWDRAGNLGSTVYEITHRLYLTIGFLSLTLMAPLAATSFNAAIRKLGGNNWKRLHRLAYLAAILACIHYYIEVKADTRQPIAVIAVLVALLGYRLIAAGVGVVRRRTPAPAMAMAAAGKARFWKGELRVARVFRETENVRTFRLVPIDGGAIPFAFSAGQFLNISLLIDGKKVNRSYTIASPPDREAYVELTIKREGQGVASRWLHDHLAVGQTMMISAPAGRFTVPTASMDGLLLIAGGVGVTPVMSILRDLTDRARDQPIDMIFSVRSLDDVIFRDELNLLVARHPNFKLHVCPTRTIPPDWSGQRGRLDAEKMRATVPDLAKRTAYICGPDERAVAVRNELLKVGLPAEKIHVESFTPVAAAPASMTPGMEMASDGNAAVTFERSGQTVSLTKGQSILEGAEGAGISIDYDCRSGICGRCRVRKISGEVTMTVQEALSDADLAEGFILSCQAHARGEVAVDA